MADVIGARDRKVLLLGGGFLLLALVVLFVFAPEEDSEEGPPSTYSAKSSGAKAAFLLLKESGYDSERWEHPLPDVPAEGSGTLLILAETEGTRNKEQARAAVLRFLRSGGRVLAIGWSAWVLPENHASGMPTELYGWQDYDPQIPSPLTRGGRITLRSSLSWAPSDPVHVVHYRETENAVVISYPVGKGEVIWWGSATPLTNAGVTRESNLALLLNTVGEKKTRVLWNEYTPEEAPGLWSTTAGTPLKWVLAQLGVLGCAMLFTYARRSGPLRPLAGRSRLSALEFVATLGGLYRRAQVHSIAVEVHYQRFRHLLRTRAGISSSAPAREVALQVRQRWGYDDAGFLTTLQRCEAALNDLDLTEQEALRLVQALNAHIQQLQLRPTAKEIH